MGDGHGSTQHHRQRPVAASLRRDAPHHGARLAARPRPDRCQGGLRRGRVRRLLGDGRPPRRRRRHRTGRQSTPACIPAAALDGPGARDRARASALPTRCTPSSARWRSRGGSQCGYCTPGFVCSMAAEFYRPDRAVNDHPDAEHGPNGFDLHASRWQPVPLHRLPPDPGRRVRPRAARRPTTRWQHAVTRPGARRGRHAGRGRDGCLRPAGGPRRGAGDARRAPGREARSPARTDWGVEVNLRGRPRRRSSSPSTASPELRGLDPATPDDASRSARRSP